MREKSQLWQRCFRCAIEDYSFIHFHCNKLLYNILDSPRDRTHLELQNINWSNAEFGTVMVVGYNPTTAVDRW